MLIVLVVTRIGSAEVHDTGNHNSGAERIFGVAIDSACRELASPLIGHPRTENRRPRAGEGDVPSAAGPVRAEIRQAAAVERIGGFFGAGACDSHHQGVALIHLMGGLRRQFGLVERRRKEAGRQPLSAEMRQAAQEATEVRV